MNFSLKSLEVKCGVRTFASAFEAQRLVAMKKEFFEEIYIKTDESSAAAVSAVREKERRELSRIDGDSAPGRPAR